VTQTKRSPFGYLPHSVARDQQLSAEALVLTAYRATHIGSFALNEKALLKARIASGMGRDVIRRGLDKMCAAGYLVRTQPRTGRNGKFARAVEQLVLPDCGTDPRSAQIVSRSWFNGVLSVKTMAAYLYMRAGTGKGPMIYTDELMDRFDWCRPTALKVIAELKRVGLCAEHRRRLANGRLDGCAYATRPPSLWEDETTTKKPGDGRPGDGMAGHLLTCPPHALPSGDSSSLTSTKVEEIYGSSASRNEPPNGTFLKSEETETALDAALSHPNLLGWICDAYPDHEYAAEELVDQVTKVLTDFELSQRVKTAAEHRVHKLILTREGLAAVRYLAAAVTWAAVDYDALSADSHPRFLLEALELVLDATRRRVGARDGCWLH
jgi:hypothetical protein